MPQFQAQRCYRNNEMLNAEHIQAAHNLKTKQFPQLGGLQSTLLSQNKGFSLAIKSDGVLQEGICISHICDFV